MLEVNSQRHINMSIVHGSQRLTSVNRKKIHIGDEVVIENGPNEESSCGRIIDKKDGKVLVMDVYSNTIIEQYENKTEVF